MLMVFGKTTSFQLFFYAHFSINNFYYAISGQVIILCIWGDGCLTLTLLRRGLLEPGFCGDLVYKLKKIVGSNNFSAQFIKIISHYRKIGFNINVLQQTACLVVNSITVGNFAFLFNGTPVGRTSDFMTVPAWRLIYWQDGGGLML